MGIENVTVVMADERRASAWGAKDVHCANGGENHVDLFFFSGKPTYNRGCP